MSDDDGDAFGSSQNAMSQDEFGGSDEDFGGIEDDDDAFGGMPSQSDSPQKASACKKESKLAVLQAQDPSHVNAKVLSKADLEKHERAEIQDTAGMLDITQGDAVALLVAHRWKKDALVDAFLGDDEKVKKDAGLAPEEPAKDEGPLPDRFAVRGAAPVPAPEPEVTTPKRKRAKKGAAPAKKTKKRATRKSTRRGGTGAASDDNEMDEDDTSAVASVTESVASASPVETPQPSHPPCVTPSPSNFECQICFCVDGPGQPSVKLACGHRFCLDCVKTLLGTCLMSDSLLGNLRCMEVGCKVMLGDEVVRALATPKQIARYESLLFDSFVFSDPHLRYCPSPTCGQILSVTTLPPSNAINRALPPTATCTCGTSFCFACGSEGGHSPALCTLWKMWQKRRAEETASGQWLLINTKECDKCHSPIEKNGGCNHMSCRKCGYHFCWQCKGDWNNIGGYQHKCNAFVDANATAISDARRELKRYMHYFDRFNNHEASAKLGDAFMGKVAKKMLEMQGIVEKGEDDWDTEQAPIAPGDAKFSWIGAQFLEEAGVVTLEARKTLMHTYVHAYYLARETEGQMMTLELFEGIQADLERAVEQLSGLLEHTPWMELSQAEAEGKRIEALDLIKYVGSRRKVVLLDIKRTLEEGRYEWAVKVA